jgi:hypothetical protein
MSLFLPASFMSTFEWGGRLSYFHFGSPARYIRNQIFLCDYPGLPGTEIDL